MRISSIKLKNFKRFTDLQISEIPKTAKLIVIVGPNGCGKSSLFDALIHWYRCHTGFGRHDDKAYYQKHSAEVFHWNQIVDVTLHDDAQPRKGMLYVRTAYRNDPDFSVDGINRPNNPSEGVRITRVIDNDQTVSDNYRRLIYDTMAGVYDETNDAKTVRNLREELIVVDPASVCLIDFDGVDPDVPRQLIPSSLGRVTWEKLLSITLDDLSHRIAPKIVVICEGSSVGTRRKDFDAEIYNRILGSRHLDVLFVSGGSSNQVNATGVSVRDALSRVLPSSKFLSLADRDDKSEAEVKEMESKGTLLLPQRNLESFLCGRTRVVSRDQ